MLRQHSNADVSARGEFRLTFERLPIYSKTQPMGVDWVICEFEAWLDYFLGSTFGCTCGCVGIMIPPDCLCVSGSAGKCGRPNHVVGGVSREFHL